MLTSSSFAGVVIVVANAETEKQTICLCQSQLRVDDQRRLHLDLPPRRGPTPPWIVRAFLSLFFDLEGGNPARVVKCGRENSVSRWLNVLDIIREPNSHLAWTR